MAGTGAVGSAVFAALSGANIEEVLNAAFQGAVSGALVGIGAVIGIATVGGSAAIGTFAGELAAGIGGAVAGGAVGAFLGFVGGAVAGNGTLPFYQDITQGTVFGVNPAPSGAGSTPGQVITDQPYNHYPGHTVPLPPIRDTIPRNWNGPNISPSY